MFESLEEKVKGRFGKKMWKNGRALRGEDFEWLVFFAIQNLLNLGDLIKGGFLGGLSKFSKFNIDFL